MGGSSHPDRNRRYPGYPKPDTLTHTGHTGRRIVSLWWNQDPGHHDVVSVKIYDVITLVDTVVVNQQADGGQWP
jgi:hypothetical protein